MSITKEDGKFALYCDVCQNAAEEVFDTWGEAVDFKTDNNWVSEKEGGGWIDICPECLE